MKRKLLQRIFETFAITLMVVSAPDTLAIQKSEHTQSGRLAKATEILDMAEEAAARISDPGVHKVAVLLISSIREELKRGKEQRFVSPADHLASLRAEIRATGKPLNAEELRDLAAAEANAGEIAEAYTTARKINDAFMRVSALKYIGVAQAKAGRIEEMRATMAEALTTARQIDDAIKRTVMIEAIVETQAEAGQIEDAFETVRQTQDTTSRSRALMEIAAAQAEAGQIEDAFVTTRQINNAWSRSMAYGHIATDQAKAGQFAEAFSTVRKIDSAAWRASALGNIALEQAKAGLRKEARATNSVAFAAARQIGSTFKRALEAQIIGKVQVMIDGVEDALLLARKVRMSDGQIIYVYFLIGVARGLIEN